MEITQIPVITMILRSGWVARIILFLLAGFSLVTWSIIFARWINLSSMKRANNKFRRFFENISQLNQLDGLDKKLAASPLGQLGVMGRVEMKRIIDDARSDSLVKDWSFYFESQFHMAAEKLESATLLIARKLDHGLYFLAIVSSIAPFMGLLGTVWGIMNSFFQIGNQGSASLPVVAPGIAEALITTIVGLAVAIPSVFFYNVFIHQVQRLEDEMDEFSSRVVLRVKRELFTLLYREKASHRNEGN